MEIGFATVVVVVENKAMDLDLVAQLALVVLPRHLISFVRQ